MAQSAQILEFEHLKAARGHYMDPWHFFVQGVPMWVDMARQAREEESHSYRIRVGSVAVATDVIGSGIAYFTGANTKPDKSKHKVCAETRAIAKAVKAGMTNIIGLVVVGDVQADDGSGLESPTLHCCEVCREGNLGKKSNRDTLVLTVQPDHDRYQLQTADELISLHNDAARGEELDEPPLFYDKGFKRWDTSRHLYGEIIARAGIEVVEATIQPPEREIVINAARTAITGYALAT